MLSPAEHYAIAEELLAEGLLVDAQVHATLATVEWDIYTKAQHLERSWSRP